MFKKRNVSIFFFRFSLRHLLSQKFYKNPKFCWKFWHNLHTHLSQCQFFIFNLKSCKKVANLYSLEGVTQRNIVLFDIVSIPYFTVFLFSLDNSWHFHTLCVFSRNIKTFSIIGEDIPLIILQVSVISIFRFLWWIVISLHLLSKLLKLLWLSPLTILKDLSCTLLIKLFDFLEENIQISGQ